MGELRWILLGLGALFLAGLALWELRRPRHSARRSDAIDPGEAHALQDAPIMRAGGEGSFDMPDIRAADLRRDPPIVMLDEMHAADTDESVQVAFEVAVDRPGALHDPEPAAAAIQWPPARQERILWLRVVPLAAARFKGRTLRQALTSCGLVHGPQDIFHWADASGRVLASVANLVRPGNFDPQTMDAQEYPGLHLFAVLPGPLTPVQTFDELLGLARELADRLPGHVQDERGEAIDASRIAELRESLQPVARPDGEADGEGA